MLLASLFPVLREPRLAAMLSGLETTDSVIGSAWRLLKQTGAARKARQTAPCDTSMIREAASHHRHVKNQCQDSFQSIANCRVAETRLGRGLF